MTQDSSNDHSQPPRPVLEYRQPTPSRRYLWWILGGLLLMIVLLGLVTLGTVLTTTVALPVATKIPSPTPFPPGLRPSATTGEISVRVDVYNLPPGSITPGKKPTTQNATSHSSTETLALPLRAFGAKSVDGATTHTISGVLTPVSPRSYKLQIEISIQKQSPSGAIDSREIGSSITIPLDTPFNIGGGGDSVFYVTLSPPGK